MGWRLGELKAAATPPHTEWPSLTFKPCSGNLVVGRGGSAEGDILASAFLVFAFGAWIWLVFCSVLPSLTEFILKGGFRFIGDEGRKHRVPIPVLEFPC